MLPQENDINNNRPSENRSIDDSEDEYFSEDDVALPDSFSFNSTPASTVFVRPPLSTERWTSTYSNHIKSPIKTFLSQKLISFFTTLVVLSERYPNAQPFEFPVIIILYDPDKEPNVPPSDDFTELSAYADEYVIVIAEGEWAFLSDHPEGFPDTQKYQQKLRSGCSIGAYQNGTAGFFMKQDNDSYIGVSCEHVLGKTTSKRRVHQPWIQDFTKYVKRMDKDLRAAEIEMKATKNIITQHARKLESDALTNLQNLVLPLKADTEDELRRNLSIGRTIKSEFDIVEYRGRQCISDWGWFYYGRREMEHQRLRPTGPDDDKLGGVDWEGVKAFGPLKLDAMVRKTGRSTGMTFGFVGGICGDSKSGDDRKSDEFWVLEEKEVSMNWFARHGDSGSAVIDSDGCIVGIVMAHARINSVKIIVDKNSRVSQFGKIAERRKTDGSVDIDEMFGAYFEGERFILIESAEMVLERSELQRRASRRLLDWKWSYMILEAFMSFADVRCEENYFLFELVITLLIA